MFCRNCGKQISEDAKFCESCGQATTEKPVVEVIVDKHTQRGSRKCPKCQGHNIQYQTVNVQKKTGCFTVILYILLAISIFGLLIVIPLALRKKSDVVTYAVCQDCGHKWKI